MLARRTAMVSSDYCQYAKGPCDQAAIDKGRTPAFFVYGSAPNNISETIRNAVSRSASLRGWQSWERLEIRGRIIFCEICRALRSSDLVVADITTLNFNVLFEIGFRYGLGLPLLPVRDSTYIRDNSPFRDLGLFDTLGYREYTNSAELENAVLGHTDTDRGDILSTQAALDSERPIFLVKSPIDTDGSIKLESSLSRSAYDFRTFDVSESIRLSVPEAIRQIRPSASVVVHLIDEHRAGSQVHNARCAFVAGVAMAAGKYVLMLQEGLQMASPIDYRDVIVPYEHLSVIPAAVGEMLDGTQAIVEASRGARPRSTLVRKELERLDLGGTVAEQEANLAEYFVPTADYNQAKRGQVTLVVGRKGSGKTAIFRRLRDDCASSVYNVVLDLKPSGYQFTKLRDQLLTQVTLGTHEHVLVVFWRFLLLCELAHVIIYSEREIRQAYQSPERQGSWETIKGIYERNFDASIQQADFSERLLQLVNGIIARFPNSMPSLLQSGEVIRLIYGDSNLADLESALAHYLAQKKQVWLLLDNLDQGWSTGAVSEHDVLTLRALLEAARSLQERLRRIQVEFRSIVFIRDDIYRTLVDNTRDRGKESILVIDWRDEDLFRDIICKRMNFSLNSNDDFQTLWRRYFDVHVHGEDSFRFMLSRTLLRPRDLLNFVTKAVQVAVNRQHRIVTEDDILQAEIAYSWDMVTAMEYEVGDSLPTCAKVVSAFMELPSRLPQDRLLQIFADDGIPESEHVKLVDTLLRLGFLGVESAGKERYIYEVGYDLEKMKRLDAHRRRAGQAYVVHPAFRRGLECSPP